MTNLPLYISCLVYGMLMTAIASPPVSYILSAGGAVFLTTLWFLRKTI
jgi:hypothetical protein